MPTNNQEKKEIPMGVSEWEAHGKKYGYWDYFSRQAKEEAYNDGYQHGIHDTTNAKD